MCALCHAHVCNKNQKLVADYAWHAIVVVFMNSHFVFVVFAISGWSW